MAEISTEIEIDASAERVWQVLTDFPAYPQWNSGTYEIRGEAKPGTRLDVRVRPVGRLSVGFRVTVLRAVVGRELCWRGQLLLPSLFAGEHFFTIEPLGNGRVRFVQREVYTGLLVPVIMPILEASNRRLFGRINKALKARVEQATTP